MPPAWCEPYRRFRPEQLSYLLLHGGGPSPTSNPSAIRHYDPERGVGGYTYPSEPRLRDGASPGLALTSLLLGHGRSHSGSVGLIGVHRLGVN